MDTAGKTLAQLVAEQKEQKYVSLETASKLSGYSTEYLERLCNFYRIEYRRRQNGAFALELDSLLRETQTILMSYDGIQFIDKSQLTDERPPITVLPPPINDDPSAPARRPQVPHTNAVFSVFSFEDSADMSDSVHAETAQEAAHHAPVHIPIVDVTEHGATNTPPAPVSSPYHPVATSVDPTAHHDPAPLFPPLMPKTSPGYTENITAAAWKPIAPLSPEILELAGALDRPELPPPPYPDNTATVVRHTRVDDHRAVGVFHMPGGRVEVDPRSAVIDLRATRRVREFGAMPVERHPVATNIPFNLLFLGLLVGTVAAFGSSLALRGTTSVDFRRAGDAPSNMVMVAGTALSGAERKAAKARPVYPPNVITGAFSDPVVIEEGTSTIRVRPVYHGRVGQGVVYEVSEQ